ncbi:MAG: FAD-dependent thymidylate synthase [Clostridiales bacterium]|jgi:thymidylate synthase (FAD)|nr:FAD-dependent thymidylate synthase [Clostridiales bacterium]
MAIAKVTATYEILCPHDLAGAGKHEIYRIIEVAGRTCYKSEARITRESAAKFVGSLVKSGHEAMLEHASMTVRFTVDRGITHELVRHRISSFAQESTRYCNYAKDKFGSQVTHVDLTGGMAIDPAVSKLPPDAIALIYQEWEAACEDAQRHYLRMIELGASPQIARSVLNQSTKSELIMTANMREWRHFLNLRAVGSTGKPHPQMLEVTVPLLKELAAAMPELFGDLI